MLNSSSVYSYDSKTGRLVLQDRAVSSTGSSLRPAIINIDNILENVSHELLEVGAWLNVIGTVREHEAAVRSSKSGRSKTRSSKRLSFPVVDATMIWSAGAVKLEEYRASVEAYQSALASG